MGKQLLKDSFTSILGKQVPATQFTPTSAQPQYPERQEVYIVLQEDNQYDTEPLAAQTASD
jgi:hypothetical protein